MPADDRAAGGPRRPGRRPPPIRSRCEFVVFSLLYSKALFPGPKPQAGVHPATGTAAPSGGVPRDRRCNPLHRPRCTWNLQNTPLLSFSIKLNKGLPRRVRPAPDVLVPRGMAVQGTLGRPATRHDGQPGTHDPGAP